MSPASCVSLPEGRGTGLYAGTSQKPHRLCTIRDRHLQTVFALCSGLRWGRPWKGEAFTPRRRLPQPVPVTHCCNGLRQRPEAGWVNLAPRRSFCGSLGSFLEFLEASLERLRGLCGARRKWSPGFAVWDPRACRAAFRPCLPPWPQPRQPRRPRKPLGKQRLRFQPKVKVHHEPVCWFFCFFFFSFPLSGIQER